MVIFFLGGKRNKGWQYTHCALIISTSYQGEPSLMIVKGQKNLFTVNHTLWTNELQSSIIKIWGTMIPNQISTTNILNTNSAQLRPILSQSMSFITFSVFHGFTYKYFQLIPAISLWDRYIYFQGKKEERKKDAKRLNNLFKIFCLMAEPKFNTKSPWNDRPMSRRLFPVLLDCHLP